jgi:hypothetical protein
VGDIRPPLIHDMGLDGARTLAFARWMESEPELTSFTSGSSEASTLGRTVLSDGGKVCGQCVDKAMKPDPNNLGPGF